MSFRRDLDRIQDVARHRRAQLSARAMLAGFIRVTAWLGRAATKARAALDPTGGAEER